MENIINLNEQERFDSDYHVFVLSEKFSIIKTQYKSVFTKNDLIKRIEQNKRLLLKDKSKDTNSVLFHLECKEFRDIDEFALNFYKKIRNIEVNDYAKSSWIYTQVKDFNMNWMHTHEYLLSSNITNLKTHVTFVYYIQIPTQKNNNEGDIIFKTEDGKLYKFTPKENDMLFFSGELPHMPIPTPNEEFDRLVYASNLNFDFNHKIENNKRIKFKNIIYNKLFR
jgi:hypothetical protein